MTRSSLRMEDDDEFEDDPDPDADLQGLIA